MCSPAPARDLRGWTSRLTVRPPPRSLASSTTTDRTPAWTSRRAAVSPEIPAPITTTSARLAFRHRRRSCASAPGTRASTRPAAAPPARRQRLTTRKAGTSRSLSRTPGTHVGASKPACLQAIPRVFECSEHLSENRGVPGSSLGLAIRRSPGNRHPVVAQLVIGEGRDGRKWARVPDGVPKLCRTPSPGPCRASPHVPARPGLRQVRNASAKCARSSAIGGADSALAQTTATRPQQQRVPCRRGLLLARWSWRHVVLLGLAQESGQRRAADAQARRSRAARGARHALRRRARVSRVARRLRLRRCRGGRRGGSRVLGAARPPRGRPRRRRVRPGAGAAGLREGR